MHTAKTFATISPAYDIRLGRWICSNPNGTRNAYLFDTKEEANRFHAFELRLLQDREAAAVKQEELKRKVEEVRASYLASFRGFLPTDPMRAGRIMQTLERQHVRSGNFETRKQTVETLVAEGRILTEDGLQRVDGAFLAINKTERAYAAHLIALDRT